MALLRASTKLGSVAYYTHLQPTYLHVQRVDSKNKKNRRLGWFFGTLYRRRWTSFGRFRPDKEVFVANSSDRCDIRWLRDTANDRINKSAASQLVHIRGTSCIWYYVINLHCIVCNCYMYIRSSFRYPLSLSPCRCAGTSVGIFWKIYPPDAAFLYQVSQSYPYKCMYV